MHDLKNASTGAICLECLFNIYQKGMSTLMIVSISLNVRKNMLVCSVFIIQ